MILYILLFIAICVFSVLVVILRNLYNMLLLQMRHISGYVQDIRTDEFFRKSTIIGELQSHDKSTTPEQQINKAYEISIGIVTDVLLQNGYDPRQYNLKGLVLIHRTQLGLNPVPRGGETNGKS